MDLAVANGAPLIGLNDSGGARIQEGVLALDGYGGIFRRNVEASGVIPQISVILGPCAGGAAYSPALTDFTFMVRDTAQMYLTGPDVVEAVTGARVTPRGARRRGRPRRARRASRRSCTTTRRAASRRCGTWCRCCRRTTWTRRRRPRRTTATDDYRPRLADIVPVEPNQPYDMRDVIAEVVDDGEFFELHEAWARNVVCALARIDGRVVGIVGNQPVVFAGVLDGSGAPRRRRGSCGSATRSASRW